jgi:hypothetical protein
VCCAKQRVNGEAIVIFASFAGFAGFTAIGHS